MIHLKKPRRQFQLLSLKNDEISLKNGGFREDNIIEHVLGFGYI